VKLCDFIFRFTASGSSKNDSICRIRLFVSADRIAYAVLTDLGDKNTGSSVTNAIEYFRSELIKHGFISEHAKIVEHYEQEHVEGGSFDFVSFDKDNNPTWKTQKIDYVCKLIECEAHEFLTPSLDIKRIYDEVERIRHDIDPYIDEPWAEPYHVINRREDIRKNMLPEGKLLEAIENCVSETYLHSLIKSDLSIIGDFYSHPKEEYICFSEFPLSDGAVDFVMFSGRSRMDVTLIEIKGADYNLINGNSYADFSAKTNQAVQQIRRRIGYITRNYEEFRKLVNEIRIHVESGNSKFNSFIGPQGMLGVDPNKDINLHTVVIGGRSKNDLHESRLRHEYERGNSPSIRIESWDSWIKKSYRQ
jgi:hypothetical protein